MLTADQAIATFRFSQQWLDYLAEGECRHLRDQHCHDSDKGAIVPKEVKQLPPNDLRRMLYVVDSCSWRRVHKAVAKQLTQQAIEALANHLDDWLLPIDKLVHYIKQRDGYTSEHGVAAALVPKTLGVDRYEAVEGRIRPFDEWLARVARTQTDRLRDTQCGSLDNSYACDGGSCMRYRPARGELKRLPPNCLRRMLFADVGYKRVYSSVLALYRRFVTEWLLSHTDEWLGVSEDQLALLD